jgi:hypothetical protein
LAPIETVEEMDDENLLYEVVRLRAELAEANDGRESDLTRLLLSRVTLNNCSSSGPCWRPERNFNHEFPSRILPQMPL